MLNSSFRRLDDTKMLRKKRIRCASLFPGAFIILFLVEMFCQSIAKRQAAIIIAASFGQQCLGLGDLVIRQLAGMFHHLSHCISLASPVFSKNCNVL